MRNQKEKRKINIQTKKGKTEKNRIKKGKESKRKGIKKK